MCVFMWCVNVSRADLRDALVNAILGFSLAPSKWVLLQARIPSAFDSHDDLFGMFGMFGCDRVLAGC